MEKAHDATRAGEDLPRKTSYGSFVRLVEPGRHVYRTKLNVVRWSTAGLALLGGAGMTWETVRFASEPDFATEAVLWGMVAFCALATMTCFVLAAVSLFSEARLEITREVVRFTKRGLLYGRKGTGTWDVRKEFHTVVEELPTFHIGGSTQIFLLKFYVEDGEFTQFGGGFDTERDSDRIIVDLFDSLERARDTTRPF